MAAVDGWFSKVLKKREGAHEKYVSVFGKSEHLRETDGTVINSLMAVILLKTADEDDRYKTSWRSP